MEGDEDEVGGVSYFASCGRVFARVERHLDGGADELAEFAEAEPDAGELAPVFDVAVAEGDGAFRSPEGRGGDAAGYAAEEDEPFRAVAVVDVERGRVGGVTEGTDDEDLFDADFVGEDSEEGAAEDHDTVGRLASWSRGEGRWNRGHTRKSESWRR